MSMWRLEEPVLEDGKVITGGMWEHQRNTYASEAFIAAMIGGYGSGKSNLLAKFAIAMALHNAPSPFMIVSPSYVMAKRTVIPAIISMLRGRRIGHIYNKSDFEIKIFYNDREGTIWIGSGEHPDRLKGPNLCGAGIDEPFIQPREVFDQILARVRDPIARKHRIMLTGTPEELNWGYDICEGEEQHKFDVEVIRAPTRANKALPAAFIETLMAGYDEKMREAYLEGNFVNLSKGLIYYAFSKDNIQEREPTKGAEWGVGMDFNVNPMAATVFWTDGQHMHYEDEILLTHSDTVKMCTRVKRDHPDVIDVFPDATGSRVQTSSGGRSDHYLIRKNGFNVHAKKSNPAVRDRHNAVNNKLGEGSLTVSHKCKNLINSFSQLSYDKLSKQEDLTHVIDAAGYPVAYLFGITDVIDNSRRWYGVRNGS